MKSVARVLVPILATLALAPSCRSTVDDSSSIELECICGQPEAAIEGCPHPACAAGKRNPDNPDCVCGGLTIEH